jgi:K+-sensing histidine kinase KdpD
MTVPDQDPDALAAQLGACLGRIDATLEHLLTGAAIDPDGTADALKDRADELHALVGAVLAGERRARGSAATPIDRVVAEAVEHLIATTTFPLVVHTDLPQHLPAVRCSRSELAGAVQRALALAAAHAGSGGDIAIRARLDRAAVVLAIDAECDDAPPVPAADRALTLQAFVADCRGRCDVADDGRRFGLRLLLPVAQRTQPH